MNYKKNYYVLCTLEGDEKEEFLLFKLKNLSEGEIKSIQEKLLNDRPFVFDILPFIDLVIVNTANYDFLGDHFYLLSSSSSSYNDNDQILEFNSDDDAKLWFELNYNI